MNTTDVTIVRVYITESSKLLSTIIDYLQNVAKIRGVTVYRAIQGFGETGEHAASFLDLSLDLPLVIEFFDQPEKVESSMIYLNEHVKQAHIVSWKAEATR